MLASLSFGFTQLTEASTVIPAAQKQQIAATLETDAEIMSTTRLAAQIEGQPPEVEVAVPAINEEARDRSLQVSRLVPVLASLLGLGASMRMIRLPDVKPSASMEGLDLG